MQRWLDLIRRNRYYRNSSLLALAVNLIFAEILLFIIGYLWFVQRTKIPLLSLVLTLIILALLTTAFILQERKSFMKKKAEARRRAGRDFMAAELKQLSFDEFSLQITRLLLKLEDISGIQIRGDLPETTLHGRKTAIGIHHANYEDEVPVHKLAEFLNRVKLEGYTQVLFISSGTFSDSCRELAEKKSTVRVQLLDLDELLDRMEHTGMFPDEKTLDALIDKEISSRKKKLQVLKKEILTPGRIRTWLGYSLLFLVLSRLFKNLSLYYTFASIIFLMLALLTWFRSLKNSNESEDEQLLGTRAKNLHGS